MSSRRVHSFGCAQDRHGRQDLRPTLIASKALKKLAAGLLWLQRRAEHLLLKSGDAMLARELVGQPGYSFSVDMVGRVAPTWEVHLAEFRGRPDVHLLEIGSFEGCSTMWLLEHVFTHPSASVTCVDPFTRHGGEPRFDHNLRVSGQGQRVTKLKAKSEQVLGGLSRERFDVVYIDGAHHALNVLMDAVSSWPLLKPGGILIFDDYRWMPDLPPIQRPQMAIDLFLEVFAGQLQILHIDTQVIVRKHGSHTL